MIHILKGWDRRTHFAIVVNFLRGNLAAFDSWGDEFCEAGPLVGCGSNP